MRTVVFRGRKQILEADETDLVRDVSFEIDRARRKLTKIQQRLQAVQEWATAEVASLTAAETKLKAAIVASLLSTCGPSEGTS